MAPALNVKHPSSMEYAKSRDELLKDLKPVTGHEARKMLQYQMQQSTPEVSQSDRDLSAKIVGELRTSPMVPDEVKAILDSTSGTTGSVLIRQDLEPILHRIFVDEFPAWERLTKAPANGLVHAFNQVTSPASGAALFASVLATELTSATAQRSNFVRQTANVAVFATLRGSSFKELAAVRQGGVAYDVLGVELSDAMVNLATDAQAMIMQGNATNASGTAANESGPYATSYFDGFRGVLGSQGSFSTNNAIQLDYGGLSLLEGLQNVAAQAANNGGKPSAIMCGMNFKQALDIELQSNKRYTDDLVEIAAGVKVNSIQFANGKLAVIPVPGTTIGSYNRTSDSVLVEDAYILDERKVKIVWLYSEGWTVLEIPAGVDTQLSNRYLVNECDLAA
jgi:hypothetical protein